MKLHYISVASDMSLVCASTLERICMFAQTHWCASCKKPGISDVAMHVNKKCLECNRCWDHGFFPFVLHSAMKPPGPATSLADRVVKKHAN